jgi:hypothetical protein
LAQEAGADCGGMIVLGRPDRSILAAAEEVVGADPIVLGVDVKDEARTDREPPRQAS